MQNSAKILQDSAKILQRFCKIHKKERMLLQPDKFEKGRNGLENKNSFLELPRTSWEAKNLPVSTPNKGSKKVVDCIRMIKVSKLDKTNKAKQM